MTAGLRIYWIVLLTAYLLLTLPLATTFSIDEIGWAAHLGHPCALWPGRPWLLSHLLARTAVLAMLMANLGGLCYLFARRNLQTRQTRLKVVLAAILLGNFYFLSLDTHLVEAATGVVMALGAVSLLPGVGLRHYRLVMGMWLGLGVISTASGLALLFQLGSLALLMSPWRRTGILLGGLSIGQQAFFLYGQPEYAVIMLPLLGALFGPKNT